MIIDSSSLLFALLALLLPVAFFSGWHLSRKNKTKGLSANFSKDYFVGLNYLLNEQPDKAISVFVKLMEVDNDTVETHLALGNLFRRRGEVDRALRIHQNLIARPNLDKKHRHNALFELGKDYLAAGLLDRAEALFREVVDNSRQSADALRRLITIYELQQDWEMAIAVALRLDGSGQAINVNIAHYHCELGEAVLRAGDRKKALMQFRQALTVNHDSVRASMRLGDFAFEDGDLRIAARHYRRAIEQNSDFAPELIPRLVKVYRQLDRKDELNLALEEIATIYHGVAPYLALAYFAYERGDVSQAESYLERYLQNTPNLRGLSRIYYTMFRDRQITRETPVLRQLQHAHADVLQAVPAYQCLRCGFESIVLYWQCPSCKTWDTVTPLKDGPISLDDESEAQLQHIAKAPRLR